MIYFLAWLVFEGKMTEQQARTVADVLRYQPEPYDMFTALNQLQMACMTANVEFPGPL